MANTTLTTAAALFTAIESGRPADVAALYADDVAVWHNFSNATQNRTENLRTLEGLIANSASVRYAVTERLLIAADRVLQRHDLHVRTRGGEEFVIPACIFITVRDGRIVRIDEYLDTGQVNELRLASGRERVPG
jgi:ketosteroid isomerase-like protein